MRAGLAITAPKGAISQLSITGRELGLQNRIVEDSWERTSGGAVILRLIEKWDAGLTDYGDIALSFTTNLSNDRSASGDVSHRTQFVCTVETASSIARVILRALASSEPTYITEFAALRAKIQSPSLRALADDWNTARARRRMPGWEDIRPRATAPYLGGIWAYDYNAETQSFTGRLAGSTIAVSYGKSYLGKTLAELFPAAVAEIAQVHLTRVISEPACVLYSGSLFKIGEKIVEGERLILPIGGDPRNPQGVLGASHYESFSFSHVAGKVQLLYDKDDWCRI